LTAFVPAGAFAMPSKFVAPSPAGGEGVLHHFSARLDWSTMTPGPMVELIAIFCR
jgi:hypothetical protein